MGVAGSSQLQQPEVAETLCCLMLQIVGRNTGRMQTARRHAEVLDAAAPYMTPAQRAEAKRRIRCIETKWGLLLSNSQNQPLIDAISPETRVSRWLSTRRFPNRLLYVLRRAAIKVSDGCTKLQPIMDFAYADELDMLLTPVGYDSFREWLLELRIARHEAGGNYSPGSLCEWWVTDVAVNLGKKPRTRSAWGKTEGWPLSGR